jgi:hypothetical protein
MNKSKRYTVRLTEEEYELVRKFTTEYGLTRAEALRLGLQLYFDNFANCEVKKTGKKVWKE